MALPTERPTDYPQLPERRHSDHPALWVAVSLGSVLIHVFAFGMLRLLLMGEGLGLQPAKALIPVEVIPVAPKAKSPAQLTQTTRSVATRNPTSVNTPPRRTSTPSSTRTDSQPTPTQKRSPATQPVQKPSPGTDTQSQLPSPSPSQNPSPGTDTQNQSPSPNPAQNPSPGTGTQNQSPSPNPAQNPSPGTTPQTPPVTNPQEGGGFNASLGELSLSGGNDIPDKGRQCKTPNDNKKSFSQDELKQLGVNLDQVLVLNVVVVIETNGKAEVEPKFTEVVQGNISPDKAVQLATEVIKSWQFEPACTYMEGKPVPYPYYVKLTISPNPK